MSPSHAPPAAFATIQLARSPIPPKSREEEEGKAAAEEIRSAIAKTDHGRRVSNLFQKESLG